MSLRQISGAILMALLASGCGSETRPVSTTNVDGASTSAAATTDSALESHNTTDAVHETGTPAESASGGTKPTSASAP